MEVGAVVAMKYVKDAIRVVKLVMEHTKHTLLVGEQASVFAISMGLPDPTNLNSPESTGKGIKWKENSCQPNIWKNVLPVNGCSPYHPSDVESSMVKSCFGHSVKATCGGNLFEAHTSNTKCISRSNHDTISKAVIDQAGHIAVGTSTNGATFKIPGRVGDGPIVGSSSYVDDEVGACGATGDGDIMMHFLHLLYGWITGQQGNRATWQQGKFHVQLICLFQGLMEKCHLLMKQFLIPPRDRIPSPTTTITSFLDPKHEIANPNYRIPSQVQEPNLVLPMQVEQQQPPQFMNTGPHYIHHNPTAHVPISYYQMHHQMQQHSQQQQQQQQHQQQVEQQYPMYFVPTRQNTPSIPPPKPTPLATPTMVPPPYKDTLLIYPTRHAPPPRPEMYRTVAGAAAAQAPFIHLPDPQHQYMGYYQV